jgi:hypothetical protein
MNIFGLKSSALGAALMGTTAALALGVSSAQAAVMGFNPTPIGYTYSGTSGIDPTKGDIRLDSIKKGSQTYTDFRYVTGATVVINNSLLGPGSSDHGDQTPQDPFLIQGPVVEQPTAADVVASLGNNNLNSIIDTEGNFGTSIFDVYFSKASNIFAFWERGMNSSLSVTAILSGTPGNSTVTLGDSITINDSDWVSTGIFINTTEHTSPQELGTYGLMFDQKVIGLRLQGAPNLDGPDYKLVAVPEPLTMLGAGTAVLFGGAFKRKVNKKDKKGSTKV